MDSPYPHGGSTCPRNVLTAFIRRIAAASHEGRMYDRSHLSFDRCKLGISKRL